MKYLEKWHNLLVVLGLLIICLISVLYKELVGEFSLSRILSSVIYTLPLCFLLASLRKRWLFVVVTSILMMTSFF